MEATQVIAKCLKIQGIEIAFGVVGVPVTALAVAMQKENIKFVAMRNEQAASYAASCVGYLSYLRPAVCLTVAGPGLVHALAGAMNAAANCWPLIIISSGAFTKEAGQGAFQEAPQLAAARVYVKYSVRIESLARVGYHIEQAIRTSLYGRPGPVYIELAREVLSASIKESIPPFPPRFSPPPKPMANKDDIKRAVGLLQNAKCPLVVIGRGAAYSHAEEDLLQFVEKRGFPFLTSPMGKGVISDQHENCVSACRSLALQQSDVILLVGARLNWMFSYGGTQSLSEAVKIIQIDIHMEELHTNRQAEITLMGDATQVVKQLNQAMSELPKSDIVHWWEKLRTKLQANGLALEKKVSDDSKPIKYHFILSKVAAQLPKDAIIINEGANTMDIGRVLLPNFFPRSRLDAGTLGTMGVGVGYAIAAAIVHPDKKIVAVEGDSAFGFSGMEVEVACRYKLNITFIVLNNGGIYKGQTPDEMASGNPVQVAPTSLTPYSRYEKIIEAFGGKGFYVDEPSQVEATLQEALSITTPTLVNIVIDASGPTPAIVAGDKQAH